MKSKAALAAFVLALAGCQNTARPYRPEGPPLWVECRNGVRYEQPDVASRVGLVKRLPEHVIQVLDANCVWLTFYKGKITEQEELKHLAGMPGAYWQVPTLAYIPHHPAPMLVMRSIYKWDDVRYAYSPRFRRIFCGSGHEQDRHNTSIIHEAAHALDDALQRLTGRYPSQDDVFTALVDDPQSADMVRKHIGFTIYPDVKYSEMFAEMYEEWFLGKTDADMTAYFTSLDLRVRDIAERAGFYTKKR